MTRRLPVPGGTYRYRYGYPWRCAIWAEVCWRIEHLPWSYDGQIFAPASRWGYRNRKRAERAAERYSKEQRMKRKITWRHIVEMERTGLAHPYVVDFWNPGIRRQVCRGFNTWREAVARAAHYTRKYGDFDNFEKPCVRATGAR